jgi:DNA-binding transcriptional MerR regulator
MAVLVPIGEFSKMTYLSVKALRHYHDVGLLEPAEVEPDSGYRRYSADQVPVAQAIRRFRDLEMPLDDIRQVLDAPDEATRNEAILTHLARMQEQLERTQVTVASLQALLSATPHGSGDVELRSVSATTVLAITELVAFDDCTAWLEPAYAELHARLESAGVEPDGPDGALYAEAFFQEEAGEVTAFVPIHPDATVAAAGRAVVRELPAVRVAVMLHEGRFDELDQTYGKLGTWVTQQSIGAEGPIREHYPEDDQAEVCWPVTG